MRRFTVIALAVLLLAVSCQPMTPAPQPTEDSMPFFGDKLYAALREVEGVDPQVLAQLRAEGNQLSTSGLPGWLQAPDGSMNPDIFLRGQDAPLSQLPNETIRYRISTANTIPTGTDTVLDFDQETYNFDLQWDGANNAIVNPAYGGVYMVGANVLWEYNNSGIRNIYLYNNDVLIAVESRPAEQQSAGFVLTPFLAAQGDSWQIKVMQNSGGDLDVTGGTFWMYRIR